MFLGLLLLLFFSTAVPSKITNESPDLPLTVIRNFNVYGNFIIQEKKLPKNGQGLENNTEVPEVKKSGKSDKDKDGKVEDINAKKISYESILKDQVRKLKLLQTLKAPEEERNPKYWKDMAHQELKKNLKKQTLNMNKAKNIILFLGDGMSLNTVTAARIHQGQKRGALGESERLSFETFPYTGLSKTYCANTQVADSSCSATAYLCGVKANFLTIGVSAQVLFNNCSASMDPNNHVSSIAAWAQKANKSTGFVTTTRLTHASPAGTYAHISNRLHESDADVKTFKADPKTCMDIATQLVTQEPGKNFDVMMGGGISKFVPKSILDAHGNRGSREDDRNLLSEWKTMHPEGVIVSNREELLHLNMSKVSKVMGVFQSDHMKFHLKADAQTQPTLSEMTETAIKLMERNENGYFLFVEGGLIDKAHHQTKAALAIDETLEFAKAIEMARKVTNEQDTLIVTTSDHGHSLTLLGYNVRGEEVLGVNKFLPDIDGKKHMTLNYAIGPQQYIDQNGNRLSMETINRDADFEYPGYIKGADSRHSGDDVGIYASGPFAHLFSGVMEQNTIPHIIAYAACLGEGPTLCSDKYTHSPHALDN